MLTQRYPVQCISCNISVQTEYYTSCLFDLQYNINNTFYLFVFFICGKITKLQNVPFSANCLLHILLLNINFVSETILLLVTILLRSLLSVAIKRQLFIVSCWHSIKFHIYHCQMAAPVMTRDSRNITLVSLKTLVCV